MHSLVILIISQIFPEPRNSHATCEVAILRALKNCPENEILFQAAYSAKTEKGIC
jgi:hypothetical protein